MTSKILRPEPTTYVVSVAEIEAQIHALRLNGDALWAAGNKRDGAQAHEAARSLGKILCAKGVHKEFQGRCIRCRQERP